MGNSNSATINPGHIMQVGLGFWASKALLVATNKELFTKLSGHPMAAAAVKQELGLRCSPRHVQDWLDALSSLGFLQREGNLETAVYSNAPDTDLFLDKNKPSYIGGILEMVENRNFAIWNHLAEGLDTGSPQSEMKDSPDFFAKLYDSPERLSSFMDAMTGIQMGNFMALAAQFDFSKYSSLCDAGGALGMLSIMAAKRYPQLHCVSFDLPPVQPLAAATIARFGLGDRVQAVAGNFFNDPLPTSDVVTMGNVLHDWSEEKKLELMRKAFDAIKPGGAFIAIENIIDNDRSENLMGLLMSLNMLLEGGEGFDYTMNDFEKWAKQVGFKRVEYLPLTGPSGAAIAYK